MSGQSALVRSARALDVSMVPETWLRYFNGPSAGFVDVETAQREMPWLFGATVSATSCMSHGHGCNGTHESREGTNP
jgi:hypothetical protein